MAPPCRNSSSESRTVTARGVGERGNGKAYGYWKNNYHMETKEKTWNGRMPPSYRGAGIRSNGYSRYGLKRDTRDFQILYIFHLSLLALFIDCPLFLSNRINDKTIFLRILFMLRVDHFIKMKWWKDGVLIKNLC